MPISVTYTASDPNRNKNRIEILCENSKGKPSTSPEYIYSIIQLKSKFELIWTTSQKI